MTWESGEEEAMKLTPSGWKDGAVMYEAWEVQLWWGGRLMLEAYSCPSEDA